MAKKLALIIAFIMVMAGPASGCSTIPIVQASKPVIESFTISPESIRQGERIMLSWDVSGADIVTIEPSIGECAPSGKLLLTPDASLTYILTATNEAGSTTSSATLTVIPAGKPDLVITEVWIEGTVVYYKIKNQGNANAKASTSHVYTLKLSPNSKQASDWVQPLAAGEEIIQSFSNFSFIFNPATCMMPNATLNIQVCADGDNSVDESIEHNNCSFSNSVRGNW